MEVLTSPMQLLLVSQIIEQARYALLTQQIEAQCKFVLTVAVILGVNGKGIVHPSIRVKDFFQCPPIHSAFYFSMDIN